MSLHRTGTCKHLALLVRLSVNTLGGVGAVQRMTNCQH